MSKPSSFLLLSCTYLGHNLQTKQNSIILLLEAHKLHTCLKNPKSCPCACEQWSGLPSLSCGVVPQQLPRWPLETGHHLANDGEIISNQYFTEEILVLDCLCVIYRYNFPPVSKLLVKNCSD